MSSGDHQNSDLHIALSHVFSELEKGKPHPIEIYLEQNRLIRIDAKNGQIDAFKSSEDTSLAVRIIHTQKFGFSLTTSLEPETIQDTLAQTWETAFFMPSYPDLEFYPVDSSQYSKWNQFDAPGLNQTFLEKFKLARALENDCRYFSPPVPDVKKAALTGKALQFEETLDTASTKCNDRNSNESQSGEEFKFSHSYEALPFKVVAQGAIQKAVQKLSAKTLQSQVCPAILKSSVATELLCFLFGSSSSEQIEEKRSFLKNKMEISVFSFKWTVIRDALLRGGYGSGPFDAEGVPSLQTSLAKNGISNDLQRDHYPAEKEEESASGYFVRELKAPPQIGFANFFVHNGDQSLESFIIEVKGGEVKDGKVKNGILITELLGLGAANPVTEDFSVRASGIFIENGILSQVLRGFTVAGNVLDVLKGVTGVGNDLRFVGNFGSPSLQSANLSVSGL